MKTIYYALMSFLLFLCGNICHAQTDVDRKVDEIKKMVEITNEQESKLRTLAEECISAIDSALYQVEDKVQASEIIYKAKQRYDTQSMGLLTDKQKDEYIRIFAHNEVMKKASARVDILRDSGEYDDEQLEKFTTEIFEYLMLEKLVYAKERYNYRKQKANIAQLKKYQPKSLRAANELEKMKHNGRTYQKGYRW